MLSTRLAQAARNALSATQNFRSLVASRVRKTLKMQTARAEDAD